MLLLAVTLEVDRLSIYCLACGRWSQYSKIHTCSKPAKKQRERPVVVGYYRYVIGKVCSSFVMLSYSDVHLLGNA